MQQNGPNAPGYWRKVMARYVMRLLAGAALAAIGGCATTAPEAPTAPPQVGVALETEPTVESGANTAVIIPRGESDALVVGSGEAGGLEVYNLAGARVGAIPAGEAVGVDARYGVPGGAATN